MERHNLNKLSQCAECEYFVILFVWHYIAFTDSLCWCAIKKLLTHSYMCGLCLIQGEDVSMGIWLSAVKPNYVDVCPFSHSLFQSTYSSYFTLIAVVRFYQPDCDFEGVIYYHLLLSFVVICHVHIMCKH